MGSCEQRPFADSARSRSPGAAREGVTVTINEAVKAALPGVHVRQTVKGDKSGGYMASEKIVSDGKRYQLTIGAWLIGSKEHGTVLEPAATDVVVKVLGELADTLMPKTFGTVYKGTTVPKVGYFTQSKVFIGGQRFQATVSAVELR